jgi:hypothetical protein
MRSPNRFIINLIIKEIWIWVEEIYTHYNYFVAKRKKFRLFKFLEPHMQVLSEVVF